MTEEIKEIRDHQAHKRLDRLETRATMLEAKLEENTAWTKQIAEHTKSLPELVTIVTELKAVSKFSARVSGFILKLVTLGASIVGFFTILKDYWK